MKIIFMMLFSFFMAFIGSVAKLYRTVIAIKDKISRQKGTVLYYFGDVVFYNSSQVVRFIRFTNFKRNTNNQLFNKLSYCST
jgi:hypothetical protein